MSSPAWQMFERALDARDPRVRFDLLPVAALVGDERSAAEAEIVRRIEAGDNDGRLAEALVELAAGRAAVPLRSALARLPAGAARVAFARALGRVYGDDAAQRALLDGLGASHWSERASAARGLAAFPGATGEAALSTALDDPNELVRANAFDALLVHHRLEDLAPSHETPLGLLRVRLMSSQPAVSRQARRDLTALLADLAAGRSVATLGLQDRLGPGARAVAAHLHDDAPYAAAELAAMDGFDRRWAIWTLVTAFADDPRTPGALRALRASEAREAIVERLVWAPAPTRTSWCDGLLGGADEALRATLNGDDPEARRGAAELVLSRAFG